MPPIRNILATNNVCVGVRVALLVGLRVSDGMDVTVLVKSAARVKVARREGDGIGVIVWLGVIVALATGVAVGKAVSVLWGWAVG